MLHVFVTRARLLDRYNSREMQAVLKKYDQTTRKCPVTNLSIYVLGSLIERLSEFKYLSGVTVFDESLSWTSHVKYVLGKVG